MSRTNLARRIVAVSLIANLLLAPLAAAQVIIVPPPAIKGRLVNVVISDGAIRMPAMLKKGWTTFRITNTSRDYHSLTVTGHNQTHSLPVAIPPGYAAFLPVKLHEGVYTVSCPMERHADNGEQVTLVVHK